MGQAPRRNGVRRNEDRFYRYPKGRVVAVIDADLDLDTALHNLEQAGVDLTKVNVLTGSEGARLLDRRGSAHGWRGRLLRLAQLGAYEGTALQIHEQALNEGSSVIYVPARGESETRKVSQVLRGVGGRSLLRFNRWSVSELRF